MKKKLCYVISDVDSSHLIEANVRGIDPSMFDLCTVFIGNKPPELYVTLKRDGYRVEFFRCSGKMGLLPTILRLYRFFGIFKPDIVHTHLFKAAAAGLTSARLRGITQRVNTRHHSSELHRYHPHAVYYDRYINSLSTAIVAITDVVKNVLVEKEGVDAKKIFVVHHGFDLKRFDKALEQGRNLKEKYGLVDDYPIIGVISRHIHWKGIQYVIPAFKKILETHPKAKLVLANATGDFKPQIKNLLNSIDCSRYEVIEFEREVFELYRCFDVLVHVPINAEYEAFGQVYVEALALGVASVFTLSGVAADFIRDGENALVVPFENSFEIANAVNRILDDDILRKRLIDCGRESVKREFSIERMINDLNGVYNADGRSR